VSGAVVISKQAAADTKTVADFFGIDMDWCSHIFRHAARGDLKAYEATMRLLAEGCQQDIRFGMADRIRQGIAREKGRK